MNTELQNKLAEAYPKIFQNIGGDMTVTSMARGLGVEEDFEMECGDGWYDLLDSLCNSIQQHCDNRNRRYISTTGEYEILTEADPEYIQVIAAQVKAITFGWIPLGTLRFYADGGDDVTEGMIEMAETMSGRICELCGSPAKTNRDSGWMHTICDACNKKKRIESKG